MSCYISSGVALGCSDGIGGIKTIYVLGATGSTVPDVTAVSISGSTGPITGITGAGTWFQFELKRNTSSLSQNVTKSFEYQITNFSWSDNKSKPTTIYSAGPITTWLEPFNPIVGITLTLVLG